MKAVPLGFTCSGVLVYGGVGGAYLGRLLFQVLWFSLCLVNLAPEPFCQGHSPQSLKSTQQQLSSAAFLNHE